MVVARNTKSVVVREKSMSIQDIPVSHSKKKKLAKCMSNDTVLVEDEGDFILNVSAYKIFKEETATSPVEDVIGEGVMNDTAEYIVFS